jgi:hypothetical protein
MRKLTKHEIIDYVVDYYKTHPRAVNRAKGVCEYKTAEGHLCAHSICLTAKGRNKAINFAGGSDGARSLILQFGDTMHKAKFQGHDPDFWVEIQFLHDDNDYWIKSGASNILTQKGESYVTDLKRRYS